MPNWCFICEPKKSFSELSSVFLASPEGELRTSGGIFRL